tara:strand:+ start:644 stop:1876 length:1233 start_codon:yes stop_codon:yes gene_type:complete
MKNKINYFLILLYLIIGFIPNIGAVDRIATHWVYLNLISLFSIIFFLTSKPKEMISFGIYKNKPLSVFILFTLWATTSLFYSINLAESVISLIRLFSVLLAIFLMGLHFKQLKDLKLIFLLILLPIVIIEILMPSLKFYDIISSTEYSFKYANDLKTFAPNKNITAAIITAHMGFIFILRFYFKKLEPLFLLLIFIGTGIIVFISARASMIGLILSLLLVYILTYLKKRENIVFLNKVCLSVFLGFFLSNLYLGGSNTASVQNRLTSINTEDTSTSERIRFYSHGISHILNNPIKGIGLGNWKTKSIEYDKINIKNYIVPYHLHNDFLQFGTETGIIGMFLYALLFLIILIINIKKIDSNYFLSTSLIISITVLFIDSNLNFPNARPMMMVLLAFIISLTEFNRTNELEK